MRTIEFLKEHSNLPGPRGNLELLHSFSKDATDAEIADCLEFVARDVENSPEEFVGMCGIVGYAVRHRNENRAALEFIGKFAAHKSWRIREAVAMGIQELSEDNMDETLGNIGGMKDGNGFEKRAVVAGLCEPKLLQSEATAARVIEILGGITEVLDHDRKLTAGEESLRKALGYGWSVAIVHAPKAGKKAFEKLATRSRGKHVRWVVKENLKKNRLVKMDADWVEQVGRRFSTSGAENP